MQPHSASCRTQFPADLSGSAVVNHALSPAPGACPVAPAELRYEKQRFAEGVPVPATGV